MDEKGLLSEIFETRKIGMTRCRLSYGLDSKKKPEPKEIFVGRTLSGIFA